MEMAPEHGPKPKWASVARAVKHSIEECAEMRYTLIGYSKLPKPVVVIENGVRVTKCPPAYASGVFSQKMGR